jgi:hypothetical protein
MAVSREAFQRAGDLIHRRPQLLQQAQPGVGQRDTARSAMQEAHPEPLVPTANLKQLTDARESVDSSIR